MTIMALMSVVSAGYSMYSANDQKKQLAQQQGQAQIDVSKEQSNAVADLYKKRRAEQQGQGSGASQAIADQGTILTSTPKTRSLLGG